MNGNTAIFYDLDSLFKQDNKNKDIDHLSLTEIFSLINNLETVGRVISQKAYSNRIDSHLSTMKKEINDMAIDPIQVFNVSNNKQIKEIELQISIDCIDTLHLKPNTDVFVIVSANREFSALAKKLKEYGKYIIGCNNLSSNNQYYKSICDEFIILTKPQTTIAETNQLTSFQSKILKELNIHNPIVAKMSATIDRIETNNKDMIINHSKNILQWLAIDKESSQQLSKDGFSLSMLKDVFKYAIKDFDQKQLGLVKFVDFIRYICNETNLKIIKKSNQISIIFKHLNIDNETEVLSYLDDSYLDSFDHYTSILSYGNPRLFIIPSEDFYNIISFIVSLKDNKFTVETLTNLYPNIEEKDLNHCIISLCQLEILSIDDTDKSLLEKEFRLSPEYFNIENIYNHFQEAITLKLSSILDTNLNLKTLQKIKQRFNFHQIKTKIETDKILKSVETLTEIKQYKKALKLLAQYLKIDRDNTQLLKRYGKILIELEDIEQGLKILKYAIKLKPIDTDLLRVYGNTLIKIKDYELGIEYLDKAIELEPNNPKNLSTYANALKRMGKIKESLPYLKKVIQIEKDNHINLNNYANALLKAGQLEESLKYLEQSLRITPDSVITLRIYAKTLMELGRVEESLPYWLKSLEIDKGNHIAINSYANALMEAGKIEESLTYWEQSLKLNPNYGITIYSYANALLKANMPEKSLIYWEKSLQTEPKNVRSIRGYAEALVKLGRKEESLKYWEKALELDENNKYALSHYKQVLRELELEQPMNEDDLKISNE